MPSTQMCLTGTPVQHYPELGLWVKREDLCCPGGPNFSKTRGVFAHIRERPERTIGVLDTSHSQGGWAVARACSLLGKHCVLYYPVRKADRGACDRPDADTSENMLTNGYGDWGDVLRPQQRAAEELGAGLIPLAAGRSAVLYHRAKKDLATQTCDDSYMMPNALKLPETVSETAAEVRRTTLPPGLRTVIVPASSGTIAAGVIQGLASVDWEGEVVVHLGYSRSFVAVARYIQEACGHTLSRRGAVTWELGSANIRVVLADEGYTYADAAWPGVDPPFPSNQFYDLKALRWYVELGQELDGPVMLWNIG